MTDQENDVGKETLKPVRQTATLESDPWTYRIVVSALGLIGLIAIVGAIYLASIDKGIPDALIALGSVAGGALAGLLAPAPAHRQP